MSEYEQVKQMITCTSLMRNKPNQPVEVKCDVILLLFCYFEGRGFVQVGANNLSRSGGHLQSYWALPKTLHYCCQMAEGRKKMDGWSLSWIKCWNHWGRGIKSPLLSLFLFIGRKNSAVLIIFCYNNLKCFLALVY